MGKSSRLTLSVSCVLALAVIGVTEEALRRDPGDAPVVAPLVFDAGKPGASTGGGSDEDAAGTLAKLFPPEPPEPPARLAPLADACRRTLCPASWHDALEQSSWFSHCHGWSALIGCGHVNVIREQGTDTGHAWFFDATTGRLVGLSEWAYVFFAPRGHTLFGDTPSLEGCAEVPLSELTSKGSVPLADECIGGDVTAGDWKTAMASLKLLCSDPVSFDRVTVLRGCRGADIIAASTSFQAPAGTQTVYWQYASSTGALIGVGDAFEGQPGDAAGPTVERYGPVPDVSGCKGTLACAKSMRRDL